MSAPDRKTAARNRCSAVLELDVRNHPGVMTHICGLFARRAYNVEGIACVPLGDGTTSRAWLLVNEDERLEQVVKQVEKLQDVMEVRRHDGGHGVFENLQPFLVS
ncbi:acetolactate synthase, small subunit [Paucidesulfovibrio gracilis DSM 16080]|uniref:acetolactate synthase n=1 Tax=Paucidesulfovibrio gracilis DSM 16080 TaxID=1121449 RepID=A0A1T4WVB0_9BACT|nr:acetolactate synthase small subunit [Paucidesulfovibrio gracilis]SKA81057.1 acetolactate synthase, small subunit [Paucidesulfovibrio gracilis DSM 16080]